MQAFYAVFYPMGGGGHPDQGLPGQPPGIWPSPGYPSHPIAPGGPPPGIWPQPPGQPPGYWGGVAPPYPDQGLPGRPPFPSQGPGFPTNPIAPGGPPPGVWPQPPVHPDQGFPPGQSPPGMVVVWVPGRGWTYVPISAIGSRPDHELPQPQPPSGQPPTTPTQPIAPTPAPKK
jgi:annexin A7/11